MVSIIVPVYNVNSYIEACIKSVMHQTYDGLMECIVVDDCGTDDSMAIVERLIAEYTGPVEFKILHHTHNRGLSAARNTGVDAAKGDYLLFLDSDDELANDCIDKLARPVRNNPQIEIVTGNYYRFFYNNSPTPEKWGVLEKDEIYISNKTIRDLFYNKNRYPISAWNKLIKKDFLVNNQLFFKEGLLHEDWLWTHHVLKHLDYLQILPDITYYHYKRPQSITNGTSKVVLARHLGVVYEEIATHLTPGEEAREAMHYLHGFCIRLCDNPQLTSYRRASRLFKQALADGHHTLDGLLLTMAILLSKSSLGRMVFSTAVKAKRII